MNTKFPIYQILGIILILVFALCVIWGIAFVIRAFIKAKRNKNGAVVKWYAISVLCVGLMIPSWIFNMGWIRMVLTLLLVPVIHSFVFIYINFKLANGLSAFGKYKKFLNLSCITYLLTYFLLPDVGDVGGAYMFFTLIEINDATVIIEWIALIVLIIHLVVLSLATTEIISNKAKK